MKRISLGMLMHENMEELSENNKGFSLKKFLDNWVVVILVCMGALTLKVIADQSAMYLKFKLIENQRER